MLGRWADLMLVAPLSCNTLGKMAAGLCDNLLLATYLSATCPVMVAPAMDEDMWDHPATKNNLEIIREQGCAVLPVGFGELASGLTGEGRMLEPEEMIGALELYFEKKSSLNGKKVLITAGPTYEAIDPVRFIGNHSSGKMGYALADVFRERGADVTLVSGPVSINGFHPGIKIKKVITAAEMYNACMEAAANYDIAVMAAAVADFSPSVVAEQKIKKEEGLLSINLEKTKDILAQLGNVKKPGQLLVGFALETNNEKANALKKLEEKNADLVVMNSLGDAGAGFGVDTNKVTLYYKGGKEKAFELKSKSLVAKDIVDSITELLK
nr:bifunctional phosphopantothenoylcysteine decarboxylase/phosphopantothenate--cysteine ligase CoaBC [Flavisolibacter sp.]